MSAAHIPRLAGWPELLAAFVHARGSRPFVWGANDCCSFAADGVLAITGRDLMADMRGYSTARAALQLLRAGGGLQAMACQRLGLSQPANLAQRADVVLVPRYDEHLLALCLGAQWCAPGEQRLVLGPMATALASWPIGER